MQTKVIPQEKTTAAPTAVQDHLHEAATQSPPAFYAKMLKRPDVREILTRLATTNKGETR